MLDAAGADLLAVDEERGRAAFAAAVAVVGELELDRRLARREPLVALTVYCLSPTKLYV